MFTALFQEVVAMAEDPAIGGQHSETPFRLTSVPANTRWTFGVTPPSAFEAMLLHSYSFGSMVPETFQVWVQQRMASFHTVVLSTYEIDQGVTVMQGITGQAQGYISLMNLDPINPHPFRSVLWQVNIPKLRGLEILLEAIRKRFGLAEIIGRGGG